MSIKKKIMRMNENDFLGFSLKIMRSKAFKNAKIFGVKSLNDKDYGTLINLYKDAGIKEVSNWQDLEEAFNSTIIRAKELNIN